MATNPKIQHHVAAAAKAGNADKPLSSAQQLILTTAAQRVDHAVLPLPDSLPQRGAVPQRLIAALLYRNLIEEVLCDAPSGAQRTDAQGRHYALRLTAAGCAAGGAEASEPGPAEPAKAPLEAAPAAESPSVPAVGPGSAAAHPSGKLGQVLAAVAAEGGATLDELVALTGWLPHTTRAALTRLRQRGHALRLVAVDGRKAYRAAGTKADGDAAAADGQP